MQSQNPEPGSARNPTFDSEIAEIREALKARPLVRWTPAFDRVSREMLASGETIETIKRAILQGNWLKLSCHDQALRRGLHDKSLIFSMRYFAGVIPTVKGKTDPGYWRNLELRLGREEKRILGREEYIRHATVKRWNLIDAQSRCETCYGYGHNRDTGEVCVRAKPASGYPTTSNGRPLHRTRGKSDHVQTRNEAPLEPCSAFTVSSRLTLMLRPQYTRRSTPKVR